MVRVVTDSFCCYSVCIYYGSEMNSRSRTRSPPIRPSPLLNKIISFLTYKAEEDPTCMFIPSTLSLMAVTFPRDLHLLIPPWKEKTSLIIGGGGQLGEERKELTFSLYSLTPSLLRIIRRGNGRFFSPFNSFFPVVAERVKKKTIKEEK